MNTTTAQRRDLSAEDARKLENIRLEILAAYRDNPEVPTHIALRWHVNLSYGGDGVKEVLNYLRIPEVTPEPVMVPIAVNRGQSANLQARPDGHEQKRNVVNKLEEFVDRMATTHQW